MNSDTRSSPADSGAAVARRHDLDALRAAAMLLGIVYHAALSFAAGMPWLVQDVRQTRWLYVFQAAVHGFRMPLFFLLSGFFTALLWRKRGLKALIGNRLRRILLPCLLGLCTIVPAVNWMAGKALESGFRQRLEAAWTRPSGPDVWTAAAQGDRSALARLLADGADVNGLQPDFGVTPLTIAALAAHAEVANLLLDSGANVNGKNRDGGTALHAAAFLGRVQMAELLIRRGADVRARNHSGETTVSVAGSEWPATEYIASLFRLQLVRSEVERGREQIIARLRQAGVESSPQPQAQEAVGRNATAAAPLRSLLQGLISMPVFAHLWFLWFLCWLGSGFAVYAWIAEWRGWTAVPDWLLLSPAALVLLLLVTTGLQGWMASSRSDFGPETSLGILPAPHVLFYYAVFFGFGVCYYDCDDRVGRLGRRWRLGLPATLVFIFPFTLEITTGVWGFRDLLLPGSWQRPAAVLLQACYAWLMTFGCMGMFRSLLVRESRLVRYLSDSAYWLYLAHLPLIIGGQLLVRDWQIPAFVKCSALALAVTGFLLLLYASVIRPTWIGTLLNGPRPRRGRRPVESPVADISTEGGKAGAWS